MSPSAKYAGQKQSMQVKSKARVHATLLQDNTTGCSHLLRTGRWVVECSKVLTAGAELGRSLSKGPANPGCTCSNSQVRLSRRRGWLYRNTRSNIHRAFYDSRFDIVKLAHHTQLCTTYDHVASSPCNPAAQQFARLRTSRRDVAAASPAVLA